ncbi:MAG TPA: MerR family transcriptional regulator [Verrucomicrobiae bacterium]|jgi:DNA-binding transcriptional MerR regulator|nr:MerR family transcriptional regulator [Verrucomicrobiae bacterium]
MAYTVKQLARLSGVSIRTLHFYDETGLLKPAYLGKNSYRFYEEPQLLMLQQILFYRELGFELKQIKQVLGRARFQKIAALQSHRKVLQKNLARTHSLIETIDKTIKHLKGTRKMKSQEMFEGFSVATGDDRFGEHIKLGGEPIDCKISSQDTNGAMSVFEFTGGGGGPRHLHHDQDEWIYAIEGEFEFHLGKKQFRLRPGECVFIPRKVSHVWAGTSATPGKIINVYQPAGKMEEFFRKVSTFKNPPIHEALDLDEFHRFFEDYGMRLLGPPIGWEEYLASQAKQSKRTA